MNKPLARSLAEIRLRPYVFGSFNRVRTPVTSRNLRIERVRLSAMGTKHSKRVTSTRKQKGATKLPTPKAQARPAKSQKDDEGWGPIGAAAKKAAKGAVKGAAKEILK